MKKTIFYTILSASILTTGCTTKALLEEDPSLQTQTDKANSTEQNETLEAKVYKNRRFEYRIAPHDRVQITVFAHPELSTASATGMNSPQGILVDSSGKVRLPLIGQVRIGGLTQPRAEHKLQSLYGRYLRKSSVHLEVLNKKLFIIGEVKAPGAIKLPNEQMTLLEAISTAKGFTDHADKQRVIILQKSSKGTRVILANLSNINSLAYANMMMQPNDIIYVTPSSMKDIAINVMPVFKVVADALLPFIRYQDLTN